MPRVSREKDFSVRRNEILDVALRLVYTKGYEQMTIQDILDELEISKGAFYHYFDSKSTLLEALIERMIDQASVLLQPILDDPGLPALEKLERYFATAGRWKIEQKDFLIPLLHVWYTDENAIVRQKVSTAGLERIAPLITHLIEQGIQEGIFTTRHTQQVGEVILSMMYNVGDSIGQLLLVGAPGPQLLQRMEDTVAVYTEAIERVLGAPEGSLHLIEPAILNEWVEALHRRSV
jgi:TetR/AcrR family transcriptional regulator, transcriptional repressor for nem operon